MKLSISITILYSLLVQNGFGQIDAKRADIHSSYITSILDESEKKVKNVFISEIKNFDLNEIYNTEYLRDYLTGNLENNTIYNSVIKPDNLDPLMGLAIEWKHDLIELLRQDSTSGFLVLDLVSLLQHEFQLSNQLKTKYGIIKFDGARPLEKNEWDALYKKCKRCYGLIYLSDMVISANNQYCAFYYEEYKNPLNAKGTIVIMKNTQNGWVIFRKLKVWIS